jgi:hypothetical protein
VVRHDQFADDVSALPSLRLSLTVGVQDLQVVCRISGADLPEGTVIAELPLMIAGVPAVSLSRDALAIGDDDGQLPCRRETARSPDGGEIVCWRTGRRAQGPVEVSYLACARIVDAATRDGQPPVDLRREGGGLTGQGRAFLALPSGDDLWNVTLTWDGSAVGLCSLGEGDLVLKAVPLDVLRDCHFMAGPVITVAPQGSSLSVHYLSAPSFDVEVFARRVAQANQVLADVLGEEPGPYRVFLRCNPYRGLSGSALPGAFVAGWNAQSIDLADQLEAFIDHELVHEWVRLDGSYQETVWHNEGLADYYGIVLPYRAGLISAGTFLDRVNLQARFAYASPFRDEPLADLAPRYWSDFRAQQEPYYRGFFYFARLDAMLRDRGSGLERLIRQLRSDRRAKPVGVRDWQAMVTAEIGIAGQELLDDVLTGQALLPPASLWGDGFRCGLTEAPVVDPGFDVTAFITGAVTGLRPESPAAQAGLLDGDTLTDLPDYNSLVRQPPRQAARVTVLRSGRELRIRVPSGSKTVQVPEWSMA